MRFGRILVIKKIKYIIQNMELFSGIWYIQEMEDWTMEEINSGGQGYIKINQNGSGDFYFNYYRGTFDSRIKGKGATKQLVFKWEGDDGDHEEGGIGHIQLIDKDTIEGELTFEYLSDMSFKAKKISNNGKRI